MTLHTNDILIWSLVLAVGSASVCSAQQRPNTLARTIPVEPVLTAEELFERALWQDKVLGQLDSAAVGYRQVLDLYENRPGAAVAVTRAQARLQWLQAAGLADVERHVPVPLASVLRGARGLQLGQAPAADGARDTSGPQVQRPVSARQQWLATVMRDPPMATSAEVQKSTQTGTIARIGAGVEALRRGLGLKGLPHFIEQERRRSRPRPLSPHEQLLSALVQEKEYQNFDGALQRYRDVVQLSLSGGIATHLSERARLGAARVAGYLSVPDGS